MKISIRQRTLALLAALLLVVTYFTADAFAAGGSSVITATVPERYRTVTAEASVGGTVTPSQYRGKDGEKVSFTVTADKGFRLSSVLLNGEDITGTVSDGTVTVTISGKDTVVSVLFVPKTHEHEWEDDFTVDVEPTCTGEGRRSIHCKSCPEIKDVTVISAAGHSFSAWETVTTPTCQSEGFESRKCVICGFVETNRLDPLPHEWEKDHTTDKEPTCLSDGAGSIHCKHCEAKKDSIIIPRTDHTWDAGTVIKEATDKESGEIVYTCDVCGKKKHVVIPAHTSPDTRDNARAGTYLFIASASVVPLIFILPRRKKRKREDNDRDEKTRIT